jgi:hypothetical protein
MLTCPVPSAILGFWRKTAPGPVLGSRSAPGDGGVSGFRIENYTKPANPDVPLVRRGKHAMPRQPAVHTALADAGQENRRVMRLVGQRGASTSVDQPRVQVPQASL